MDDVELQDLTADDLAQNAGGTLSATQRQRLQLRLYRLNLLPILIVTIGMAVPLFGASGYFYLRGGQAATLIAPLVIALFLSPIFVAWYLLRYRRPMAELATGKVSVLEGPIQGAFLGYYWSNFFIRVKDVRMSGYGPGFSQAANDPWFRRVRELYHGKTPVRVFYLPRSRTMVALVTVA